MHLIDINAKIECYQAHQWEIIMFPTSIRYMLHALETLCGDELGIIVFPYHGLIVTAIRSICVKT